MATPTLRQCFDDIVSRLMTIYPDGEARWMARIIFEELKGYTQVDLAIKANDILSDFLVEKVDSIVERLLRQEPIQYIFGHARFYGLTLTVDASTLIPRSETEELVDMIVRDYADKSDVKVFDVCTGSGCIAVALARHLRFAQVDAIDISEQALKIAMKNASELRVNVDFKCADALSLSLPSTPIYDVVVSNPPYITPDERMMMSANVLDFEPSSALFVPQSDPLLFYDAIALYASSALKPDGTLYFEINPRYAEMLTSHLYNLGWQDVDVLLDMSRKKRFIKAKRPTE